MNIASVPIRCGHSCAVAPSAISRVARGDNRGRSWRCRAARAGPRAAPSARRPARGSRPGAASTSRTPGSHPVRAPGRRRRAVRSAGQRAPATSSGSFRQRASGRRRSAPSPVHGASSRMRSKVIAGAVAAVPTGVALDDPHVVAEHAEGVPHESGARGHELVGDEGRAALLRLGGEQRGLAAGPGAHVEPPLPRAHVRRPAQRERGELRALVLHAQASGGDARHARRVAADAADADGRHRRGVGACTTGSSARTGGTVPVAPSASGSSSAGTRAAGTSSAPVASANAASVSSCRSGAGGRGGDVLVGGEAGQRGELHPGCGVVGGEQGGELVAGTFGGQGVAERGDDPDGVRPAGGEQGVPGAALGDQGVPLLGRFGRRSCASRRSRTRSRGGHRPRGRARPWRRRRRASACAWRAAGGRRGASRRGRPPRCSRPGDRRPAR